MQTTLSAETDVYRGISRVAPPSLDYAQAKTASLSRKLRETERPCGCKSGAALTLMALIGWPAWTLVTGPPQTFAGVALAIAAYAAVVLAAALVGKVAGIAVGRWRHRRLQRQLTRHLVLAVPAGRE
jgi:hypothetical protein